MIKLSTLKRNPDNPRLIKDQEFRDLVESIKKFPKMLELRPIVIDEDNMIHGGDKRFLALLEAGYTEVPNSYIKKAKDFTPEELAEFLIKDNTHAGAWNYEALGNRWDDKPLDSWGVKTGFKPIGNPSEDDRKVTDEDTEDAAASGGHAEKKAQTIEVLCPHCGKAFNIH